MGKTDYGGCGGGGGGGVVEFCNMAGKIRWIYKNFRENYITG